MHIIPHQCVWHSFAGMFLTAVNMCVVVCLCKHHLPPLVDLWSRQQCCRDSGTLIVTSWHHSSAKVSPWHTEDEFPLVRPAGFAHAAPSVTTAWNL